MKLTLVIPTEATVTEYRQCVPVLGRNAACLLISEGKAFAQTNTLLNTPVTRQKVSSANVPLFLLYPSVE